MTQPDVSAARPARDLGQTAVIGGGFFGSLIAEHLSRKGQQVVLLEREHDLLQRASYHNQARVHNGYHYPRSYLTAARSHANFGRFATDYHEAIVSGFTKLYAVGRELSKVTGHYFEQFCQRIGAPIEPAPAYLKSLFCPDLVEDVFLVREFAFDAVRLKERCRQLLAGARVDVQCQTIVESVERADSGRLRLRLRTPEAASDLVVDQVFNCTYSGINAVLSRSNLPLIPLKHELAEMALVEPPDVLRDKGITLMCGPFFSCMPFPARGLHSLSHVRYTPHCAWHEGPGHPPRHDGPGEGHSRQSNYAAMLRDAQRYVPALGQCRYVESMWEVKTVLPVSEADDSRPILFQKHWGLPNLHCVMGAKLDNIYDILDEIDAFYGTPMVQAA